MPEGQSRSAQSAALLNRKALKAEGLAELVAAAVASADADTRPGGAGDRDLAGASISAWLSPMRCRSYGRDHPVASVQEQSSLLRSIRGRETEGAKLAMARCMRRCIFFCTLKNGFHGQPVRRSVAHLKPAVRQWRLGHQPPLHEQPRPGGSIGFARARAQTASPGLQGPAATGANNPGRYHAGPTRNLRLTRPFCDPDPASGEDNAHITAARAADGPGRMQ